MSIKVLYTGSFNPFHNGHQYVYDIACKCFGKENVWIGIGQNSEKATSNLNNLAFSVRPITKNIITYTGLTAKVLREHNFDLIVRGVRPGRSLEDENDLLYWNRKLSGGIETILIPTPPEVNQISSGAIRILDANNATVLPYMNEIVYYRWKDNTDPYAKKIPVYFGKCCSGKSTHLMDHVARSWDNIVLDMDKTLLTYHNRADDPNFNMAELKEDIKKIFYSKNVKAFYEEIVDLGHDINWEKLFGVITEIEKNNCKPLFDMPNIGSYYNCIPKKLLGRFKFVKVSTSEENRKYFAELRKVNPLLLECNDLMYVDMPFWDEEIVIERK